MNVWIVNPYDNLPLEGYRKERYWLVAEAFARAGHAVTYWTQDFSHAHKAKRRILPDVPKPAFNLRLLPVPPYRANVCLGRIFSHAVWAHRLAAAFRAERNAPDLTIVSSPPLLQGCVVRGHAAAHALPYVVDVMDAWPETFARLGLAFRLAGIGRLMRRIVRKTYRDAAAVTCVAQRYAEMVKTSYGVTAPVKVFHHGIDRDAATRPVRPPRIPGLLRLVYIGNMSLSYDLATVIDAVRSDPSLALELAGNGPDEHRLRARAAGCDRIAFDGYLDEANLRAALARADAGIIPMFGDSCVGVPYKLADYAAAGLPVLSSLPGETADLLRETGAGLTYAAGDANALLNAAHALDVESSVSGSERLARRLDAQEIYTAYVAFCAAASRNAR